MLLSTSFSVCAQVRHTGLVVGVLWWLFLSTSSLWAQGSEITAPQRGFHAGGSYALSDLETLSSTSGELMFNLPVGSLPPGRGGLSAQVKLHYSSKLWDLWHTFDYTRFGATWPAEHLLTSDEGGWRYTYHYWLKLEYRQMSETQGFCDGSWEMEFPLQLFLVTPDGGKHQLFVAGHMQSDANQQYMSIWPDGRPVCSQPAANGPITYYTADGSMLRLQMTTDEDSDWENNPWTLSLPDGMQVLGGTVPGSTALQRMLDRNGNYVEVENILRIPTITTMTPRCSKTN